MILTNYDTDGDIVRSIEAGASGYLLKGAPPDELLLAVRSAAAGESAWPSRSPPGRSNGEIARTLVITEGTAASCEADFRGDSVLIMTPAARNADDTPNSVQLPS